MTQNSEYLKAYMSCKIECPCGSFFSRCNFTHHRKSKHHIKFVETYLGGFIDDHEEYDKLKLILSCRRRPT